MRRIFYSVIILIVFFSNCLYAYESAFDFKLYNLNNELVSLDDFKGKSLILLFWTSWCPYCRREIVELNKLYPEIKKDDIEIVAINIKESKEKIERFLKDYPLVFEVLLDKDGYVAFNYKVLGIPHYVFIDKEGKIKFKTYYFPVENYRQIFK